MPKFKIGDKVKFVKWRVDPSGPPDYWTNFVDEDKVYTVGKVTDGGNTIMLKDDVFNFLYSPKWLDKVEEGKCEVKVKEGRIKDVKFSGPATIVFWTDGTKTVVKCRKGDKFDPEKGIAMACAKKLLGNEDGYHKEIAKRIDSAAAKTLREEAYRLCGKTVCAECPLKAIDGECPNFLATNVSQLRKFVNLLREARKHGDS